MKRSLLLAAFLGLTMSAIYMLPAFKITPSAMSMEVPNDLDMWRTVHYEPSEKEVKTLAPDTKFEKRHCILPRFEDSVVNYPSDVVDLSIVMSGDDLTNSIHRPERCMVAQGHTITDSSISRLKLENGKELPVRRLVSRLELTDPKTGQAQRLSCLTYYFFVGHEQITSEHSQRNKIDILDRLLKGEAQHWAYVLVTMPYGEGAEVVPGGPVVNLESADKKARNLLSELAQENVNWKMLAAR